MGRFAPVGRYAPPIERFLRFVDKDGPGGCWLWTGGRSDTGYGTFNVAGRTVSAHRYAWETFVGPIPEGHQIDHVWANGCRHLLCVNYENHLEVVTSAENMSRGTLARRTHCIHGHLFDEANTYWRKDRPGTRICKACTKARMKAAR